MHENITAPFEEHGQHWTQCLSCGASWLLPNGPDTEEKDWEQIDTGDESCTQNETD